MSDEPQEAWPISFSRGPKGRWWVILPASLVAALGLVVTLLWVPLGWLGGIYVEVLLTGLSLFAFGSWAAVVAWKRPVRGVQVLGLAVALIETVLAVAVWALHASLDDGTPDGRAGALSVVTVALLAVTTSYGILYWIVRLRVDIAEN